MRAITHTHTHTHMFWLVLCCLVLGANAGPFYNCDKPPLMRNLNLFVSTLVPVQPVTYSNGMVTAIFPALMQERYQTEAVRGNGSTQCLFCPYQNPPDGPNPILYEEGGRAFVRSPMYGPCLDLRQSLKTACTQNTLLYPPTFVGEYYYPDQVKMQETVLSDDNNFAEHRLIVNESSVDKLPTNYALGRGRITDMLAGSSFRNVDTGLINQTLTNQFFKDYTQLKDAFDQSSEGWMLWGQHFCAPGCHRDAQYFNVAVREQDWKNKSAILQYLNRVNSDTTESLALTRCSLCPRYQASYWWSKADNELQVPIAHLSWNTLATVCYPWFGALPQLIALGFSTSHVDTHSNETDGIIWPLTSTYVTTLPCDVNTYNDVCAHSIRYYAKVAQGGPQDETQTTLLTAEQANAKARCKPCPIGYHTDGKTGAWFCLPPPGQLMRNRKMLLQYVDANNESIAWSRRDVLGYEFECGYLFKHCVQCPLFQMSVLPDDFNQQKILTPLLNTMACAIGNYCPHPLRVEPILCPASKPWSPEGSSSVANCTCARGTFWNTVECETCHEWDSCPLGQYLKGLTDCTAKDGATSTGVCTPCTNKPASATYTGSGIERLASTNVGVCPFECAAGLSLIGTESSPCIKRWQCLPLSPFKTPAGIQVYAPDLLALRDALIVRATTCITSVALTYAMTTRASIVSCTNSCPYLVVSQTCLGKGLCSTEKPCGVSQPATYFSDVVCSFCPAPPAGATFTQDALNQNIEQNKMCKSTCRPNFYVNGSMCQSCTDLSTRVCGEGIWQIRGGGCLGNSTPFSTVLDASWCIRCPLQIADIPLGKYLDLELCAFTDCPLVSVGQTYHKRACKEADRGEVATCTLIYECQENLQYLNGLCTVDNGPVCLNCTFSKAGFFKVANCTRDQYDTAWDPCPVGSYCEGSSDPRLCPFPRTSLLGSGSLSECFCPVGMEEINDVCVPMVCSDATASVNAPGDNVRSAYYMELDPLTRTTRCSPCPDSSFTLDPHAVGIASCRCALDSHLEGGVCVACSPTACVGCWQGYCPASSSSAPFAVSLSQCAAGFDSSSVASSMGGTGSAAYVEEANSRLGWTPRHTSDLQIKQLAVTSSRDDDGSHNAIQIALYTTNGLIVYVLQLPPLEPPVAPERSNAFWSPVCESSAYKSAHIAVSRWLYLESDIEQGDNFNLQYSTYVGQVAYHGDSLILFTNQVSMKSLGTPVWSEKDGCCAWKQRETLIPSNFYSNQTDIPAMQHQFAYPGGVTAANTFYVAYNDWVQGTCGVIAFNADTSERETLDLSQSSKRRITAMAVLASGPASVPMLYLAFDTSPSTIKLVQWAQAESDELFFTTSPAPAVVGLSYAWLSDQLLWARVLTGGGLSTTNVYTADRSYQRTFTLLEQMPTSSHPSLGPSVVSTGPDTGLMVAASGHTIFTLPIMRCSPIYDSKGVLRAQYWDGSVCKINACVRGRSCSGLEGRQYYNATMQRCVCSPGYYETGLQQAVTCVECPEGYYCTNGQKVSCGPLTSLAKARSVFGCVCRMGQYHPSGCSNCPAGMWCPNQWESQVCPGNVDMVRSTSLQSIYPYTCVCAAGSSGPGCTPCPSGKYCSSVTGSTITNYALSLTINYVTTATSVVCDVVRQRLVEYFQGSSVQIYCLYIPALTQHTTSLAVFMVQTSSLSGTNALAQIWANFTSPLLDFTAIATTSQMASYVVPNNEPRDCPIPGKVSLPDGTGCQCASGYETTAQNQCAGCKANFFKVSAGAGTCTACPTGTTSAAGAAACSSRSTTNNGTSSESASSVNVPVIAGGVVGGVVVVVLVILGINQFYAVPAVAETV